jgi:hypothetical protein
MPIFREISSARTVSDKLSETTICASPNFDLYWVKILCLGYENLLRNRQPFFRLVFMHV